MTVDRKKVAAQTAELARQHADTGVWLLPEVLNVTIGRRPAWAPTTDPRHSKALDAIGQESVLDEHKASLREQNERISEVGEPVSFLVATAAGLGVIEVLGCTALMTSLGFPGRRISSSALPPPPGSSRSSDSRIAAATRGSTQASSPWG